MRKRRGTFLVAAAVLALFVSIPVRATQYWELAPVVDPRAAYGTYTVVGGKTSPDGVNFTLKNNNLDNPVQLTLVSTKTGATLHLSAFKNAEPFLDKDTDRTGTLVVRFRTGEDMHFKVAGPQDSTYQLALWRGPAIKLAANDPVVAMDAAQAGGAPPHAVSGMASPSHASGGSNTPIYILLGGIFVVLVVIAGLIFRGQQMRGKS